ncbi:MAG TPA: TonB family protein [Steroidobacteraceae bacterium]|nr:TonB family protein [Steroidobacteraceae bacterium]
MNPRNDPDLAQRLILHAARKAPAALSERLEEEWLADLQSRSGSLERLRLALGCCWATGIITRDVRVPQLAASGGSATHRPLLGELHFDLPLLSRRTVTFIVIAGLHVLLIYAFASGFAQHMVAALPNITHAVIIEETHPRPPPAALNPTLRFTKVIVPDPEIPEIPLIVEAKKDDPLIGRVGDSPGTPDLPPARPVTRVLGGPGKGFPATADYYPDASRRIAETGAANVQVCVDTQGRLTAAPVVAKSSGSRRIDDAALTLALAGSGHYRPSTENGEPVNSCYPYRIRFELNN